ncbi:hypothetical protein HB364_27525 [Pseudoflavitalea sp. X16]|uniref:hypothetical protein n=1 Tax=Paraflavitalea devenefica TaxID=2716334 RepID=UPI00141F384B|nr:hypothetical protein [Paraflavitalea devenefica]NII28860.1 hypothetical protein [Paraflavitalea devenefica]
MKKLHFTISFFCFLIITALSCKKECPAPPTPPAPVIKTVEELLTAKSWQLQEARFLQDNSLTYYKRGETSNGNIYDVDSIRFNANNTGWYRNSGGTSTFNWNFLDPQKTKLRLFYSAANFTVNWENVHVTDSTFRYAEYYTIPGSSTISMGAFYRIPRQGNGQ